MLNHHYQTPTNSGRVVIVGAGGFVGVATMEKLIACGIEVIGITRRDVDLLSGEAAEQLARIIHANDILVFIAANVPVKNNAMLIDNLLMANVLSTALGAAQVSHLIYLSSDAVYVDSRNPLTEASCAQPASLHGAMHLTREVMLTEACNVPLCILRPTLIYGANDPHNGYGPNRFRRLAQRGEEIVLFGAGEEQRDHIYIDDVAEIIVRCVLHKSQGILNIATGTVTSFFHLAKKVAALAPIPPEIRTTERSGPMPHRGYRAFDVSSIAKAFPDFKSTPLDFGLKLSQREEFLQNSKLTQDL
jgi:nucleoside-diphosphate-sugar epimerase